MGTSTQVLAEAQKRCCLTYRGVVYTGPNHALILLEIQDQFPEANEHNCEYGFTTTTNDTLNRIEATPIAAQQGLLRPVRPGMNPWVTGLCSEHMIDGPE